MGVHAPMNRRGSLEWSLETVGKLIFYALILVALIYMSMKLVEIFTHGEQDWRAKQNLKYLGQQAEVAIKDGKASVIIDMPDKMLLTGFDADQKTLVIKQGGTVERAIANTYDLVLQRPKDCKNGKSCVCAYRLGWDSLVKNVTSDLVQCVPVAAKSIAGTFREQDIYDFYFMITGTRLDLELQAKQTGYAKRTYEFGFVKGPKLLHLSTVDGALIIDECVGDKDPGCA